MNKYTHAISKQTKTILTAFAFLLLYPLKSEAVYEAHFTTDNIVILTLDSAGNPISINSAAIKTSQRLTNHHKINVLITDPHGNPKQETLHGKTMIYKTIAPDTSKKFETTQIHRATIFILTLSNCASRGNLCFVAQDDLTKSILQTQSAIEGGTWTIGKMKPTLCDNEADELTQIYIKKQDHTPELVFCAPEGGECWANLTLKKENKGTPNLEVISEVYSMDDHIYLRNGHTTCQQSEALKTHLPELGVPTLIAFRQQERQSGIYGYYESRDGTDETIKLSEIVTHAHYSVFRHKNLRDHFLIEMIVGLKESPLILKGLSPQQDLSQCIEALDNEVAFSLCQPKADSPLSSSRLHRGLRVPLPLETELPPEGHPEDTIYWTTFIISTFDMDRSSADTMAINSFISEASNTKPAEYTLNLRVSVHQTYAEKWAQNSTWGGLLWSCIGEKRSYIGIPLTRPTVIQQEQITAPYPDQHQTPLSITPVFSCIYKTVKQTQLEEQIKEKDSKITELERQQKQTQEVKAAVKAAVKDEIQPVINKLDSIKVNTKVK